jgi:hypothetical protein
MLDALLLSVGRTAVAMGRYWHEVCAGASVFRP